MIAEMLTATALLVPTMMPSHPPVDRAPETSCYEDEIKVTYEGRPSCVAIDDIRPAGVPA